MNPVGIGILATWMVASVAPQPEKAKELNEAGLEALQRGDAPAAKKALAEALDIWKSLGREFEPHAAIEMMNLGDALCAEGNWGEGGKYFEQALVLNQRSIGTKHIRTVANMNRVANVWLVEGQVDRAEPMYREALGIERALYPNHLQTAHTLAGLGSMHARARKLDEALAEAEEGLEITLRAVGDQDAETGMAYTNLAQIYRISGRLDRALPLLRKAHEIFARTLGPNHPRVASVMSQEGLALMRDNKLVLAEEDMVRAVDLLKRYSATNVELSVAEYNLASLRVKQKKFRDADRLLSEALSLQEQYSVKPDREMAATLELLSQVRAKENRPEDAARLKDRASMITSYR